MKTDSPLVIWIVGSLGDIRCKQYQRTVGADNCLRFYGLILQISADRPRCYEATERVKVTRYASGADRAASPTARLSLFHLKAGETRPSSAISFQGRIARWPHRPR